jgi:hypothetical protein
LVSGQLSTEHLVDNFKIGFHNAKKFCAWFCCRMAILVRTVPTKLQRLIIIVIYIFSAFRTRGLAKFAEKRFLRTVGRFLRGIRQWRFIVTAKWIGW